MKKYLHMFLALVVCVCLLAGCAASPAKAPAAQSAASGGNTSSKPFKLGAIGPITGEAAIYGQAVKNAMELAVKEINAMGGMQFELNFQDDAHDAETSVNAYGTLMDWGMQLLIGPVTSTPAAAVAAEADSDGLFMLTPAASSPTVIEGRSSVFQMCFQDPKQGASSADYIASSGIGTKIAVIYNNGDAYSTGIYEQFALSAAEKGLEIVYTGTFTDDSDTDFSSQLTAAQQAGADLLYLPIYYTPISLMMTQAAAMKYAPVFFGVDGMDGILALEGFNTALAEGAYMLTPFSTVSNDEFTSAFVAGYIAAYGETPNQFAADGYDCVYAVYEAIKAANITSDMSAEKICGLMVGEFVQNMVFNGATGKNVKWLASGEVSKTPMIVVIKQGRLHFC